MATIREIITTEVAPPLLGPGGKTLSDIYAALTTPDPTSATQHAELMSLLAAQHAAMLAKVTWISEILEYMQPDLNAIKTNTQNAFIQLIQINEKLGNINTKVGEGNALLVVQNGYVLGTTQAVNALGLKLDAIDSSVEDVETKVSEANGLIVVQNGYVLGTTQAVEAGNTWLDAIASAVGAAPYGDLELSSLRGMLNNASNTLGTISESIGNSPGNEPYLAVRPYLSQISQNTADSKAAVLSGNTLLGDIKGELVDLDVSVLAGNSILSGIDINIGSNNTLTADVTAAINATSGSIRGEIVALREQDATNHGAAQAQLITIAGQTGMTRLELQALNDSETGVSAVITNMQNVLQTRITEVTNAISTQTTALNAATATQTAAIDALFEQYLYSDGDQMTVAQRLYAIDYKLSFVAREFGWGTDT